MDWRSFFGEREDPREWWNRTGGQVATTQAPPQPDEGGGFFGGISDFLGEGVDKAAGFFGAIGQGIYDPAKKAVTGIKDVVEGSVTASNAAEASEKRLEVSNSYTKQMNAILGDKADTSELSPQDRAEWERLRDERKRALEKFDKETDYEGGQALARKEGEEAQKVDPLQTAAASAETFLNVAGGGGLIKAAGKGVIKQGAKAIGKEAFKETAEQTAKQTTKNALRQAAKQGPRGAMKTIGTNAFEGATTGAAYGALQPLTAEGENASQEDIWRGLLMGGALGGAVGAVATPIFDRDVRTGLRKVPGEVVETARNNTPSAIAARNPAVLAFDDQYQQLAQRWDNTVDVGARRNISKAMAINRAERGKTLRSLQQGGYVSFGGNPADDLAREGMDAVRRQLDGEDIRLLNPDEQQIEDFAQEVAHSYNSVDEYVDEAARRALSEESGKGVSLIPDGEAYGYGYKRVSDHAPWYSDMYRELGRKPSLRAVKDRIVDALETGTDGGGLVYPEESRVFQLLKDRDAGMAATIADGPPPDLYSQFADDLGMTPVKQQTTKTATSTLDDPITAGARFDTERDLQNALGRMEARDNPLVDYIDPLKRGGIEDIQQAPLIDGADPYAGFTPDLTRPALPAGETVIPTSKEAKKLFKKTGEPTDFMDTSTGKKPIELPASTAEGGKRAVRITKGGKAVPFKYLDKDEVDAIRAIADDDTGSAFTVTRTPEMNLEEALRKRGGVNSKEFRVLQKFDENIRQHTADYTEELTRRRDFLEKFASEYKINGQKAMDMRKYLEAKTPQASKEALQEYAEKHGDEAADGLRRLRDWWRAEKDVVRNETNAVIKEHAGEERMIGDLGETYVPRVYRRGAKGLKSTLLDVKHAGMEALGGKKGLFNLESNSGYLSKETESMGGVLRGAEGIPLNSEYAKPKTTFLSAAQKRTANAPIDELEDPLTSMMRYFEATGRAKHYTPDIARGQEFRKAIELVNNETDNLRQMDKAFNDQINSIAGKTSRIDRPLVDSKTGNAVVNAATKIQSRIARSTILGSSTSAFAQTGQLPLVVAENGAKNFQKGMADMIRVLRSKGDDVMSQSALMKARYPKYEQLFTVKNTTKMGNKATNLVAKPFRIIEHAASEAAWRSSYNRAVNDLGLTGKAAIKEADRITAKIIGERSAGARAALYESKALGPVTSYTLEVNQLYQVAKQYFKRDPKKAMKLVGAIWLYNQGYEALTGNKLNADPLAAGLDAANYLTSDQYVDDEGNPIGFGERLTRAGGRLGGEFIDAMPLGGPVVGELYPEQGFRVPFGGGRSVLARDEVFGDTNFGRYGGGTPIASGLRNPLLLLGIPGMNQAQRSIEGMQTYQQGYSESPSGRRRYDIAPTAENYWRSLLFGPYGASEGQAYLEDQRRKLAGLNIQ